MDRSNSNISYLQTAGRALEILMMYQTDNALTLNTIAKRMNISTTVAYRLVYTLTTDGFLYQDPESKKYLLGDKVMTLGFCNVQRLDVKRVSRDLMLDFYFQTGYSLTMTIPCDDQSLCVTRLMNRSSSRLTTIFAGSLLPLHLGASNRVLLAFMEEEKQDRYIRSLHLPQEQERTLRQDLAAARERGYDYSCDTLNPGLYGLAFPIFNSDNLLAAGVSIGGPVSELEEPGRLERYVQELSVLANAINNQMGSTRNWF